MRANRDGIPLGGLHWDRLFSDIDTLQIALPGSVNAGELDRQVQRTLARNGIAGDARVRLAVFRGEGGLYETGGAGGYVIEASPIDPRPALNGNGLVLGVYEAARKSCDLLANIKSNNFLVYVMAALHATKQGWNDSLVLNSNGRVADSTIANVFWVQGNVICTTPLSEGGVAGVMRKHLLQQASGKGFAVEERSVSVAGLESADEVFLTNAISGLRWVKQLNGRVFANAVAASLYPLTL